MYIYIYIYIWGGLVGANSFLKQAYHKLRTRTQHMIFERYYIYIYIYSYITHTYTYIFKSIHISPLQEHEFQVRVSTTSRLI